MVFSSPLFLFLFFPLAIGLYFLAPRRCKNLTLLLTSLAFYTVGAGGFVLLLLYSIGINFGFGLLLPTLHGQRLRAVTTVAIVANLIPLLFYKYTGLAVSSGNQLLAWFSFKPFLLPDLYLPAGISFFTFQGIAYVIDIHRRQITPCRSLLDFALFISFFPQLVAGPIVRYQQLSNELKSRKHTWKQAEEGIWRFCVGLSKKVLLADNLGRVADQIFSTSFSDLSTGVAWVGVVCYTFQIFFDFSGYSDMAIGIGRLFGLSLPENFRQPYLSSNVTEFWRRWHITLSSWFRDYLYIPLGGNRHGTTRTVSNLLIVFALCGLWHGAAYTFVVWGLFHGLLLLIERIMKSRWKFTPQGIPGRIVTMGLVMTGWVIFRSDSLDQAGAMLLKLAGGGTPKIPVFDVSYFLTSNTIFYLCVAATVAFWPLEYTYPKPLLSLFRSLRPALIAILTAAAIVAQSPESFNPFIYFQF